MPLRISPAIGKWLCSSTFCVLCIPLCGIAQESNYSDQDDRPSGAARERDQASIEDERDQPPPPRPRDDAEVPEEGRRPLRLEFGATLQEAQDALIVSQVTEQSAAAQAGLREEDIIVSVAGRSVRTPDQFDRVVLSFEGRRDRVPIVVLRDDRQRTVYLDLGRFDDRRTPPPPPDYYEEGAWLGVVLNPQYEDYAVVRRVYPGSPAEEAQIREGDWILAVNNRRVRSPAHLSQLISSMEPGRPVDIEIARRVTRTLTTTLGDLQDQPLRGERITRRPADRFGQPYRDGEFNSSEFQDDRPPVIRDRFGPDERGIRDRLDRDLDRDRLLDRDEP